jgi:hypothetical protein
MKKWMSLPKEDGNNAQFSIKKKLMKDFPQRNFSIKDE